MREEHETVPRQDDFGRSRSRRTPRPDDDWSNWMIFHGSGPLNLASLTPDQIDIADITQGLGGTNRFAGQTRSAVSVLWHSLMVAAVCENRTREIVLEALMHDAAEAYVGDWIAPLQSAHGPQLTRIRSRIQTACFQAAGLPKTTDKLHPDVKTADSLMLRYEIQAPWGYGRTVTWHDAPIAAERQRVDSVMGTYGPPTAEATALGALRRTFTQLVGELSPESAPIRTSIAEAIRAGGRKSRESR